MPDVFSLFYTFSLIFLLSPPYWHASCLYKFKKQNGSPNIPEEHERRHTDEL